MTKRDPILDSFGLVSNFQPPVPAVTKKELKTMTADSRDLVLRDFETARDNLHKNIALLQDSIEELQELCSQAQSDKYYGALASLMKAATEMNRELLEIQRNIREIELIQRNEPKKIQHEVVLTTAQLQKLINPNKEEQDDGKVE